VQVALEGLAAERAALRREREALARQVQAVEEGTRAAVRAAVVDSLAGAPTERTALVQAATRPLLDWVAGVTAEAGQAEAALRGVVLWASWRLLGWTVAVGATTVLLGWLMSSGVWWGNTSAIGAAQERRAELQAEVAELQTNQHWAEPQDRKQRCGAGSGRPKQGCQPRARRVGELPRAG